MKKTRHSSLRENLATSHTVGGGPKKVLYTLNTVRRIGLKNSARALTANNACKACGLGMGGQRGGMINELDEYPSVCNKSVQAQSTDIQPPIPDEIFQHPISELAELTPYELEHLGRLAQPIYKARDSERYRIVDWDWAIDYVAERFAATDPARSFFYSSGRSSNEAGFVLQLLARLYGSNNISNCSYYCHQATGVGLGTTLGTGTATVELEDLAGCDLVFILGANPASNHPRLMHKLKAVRDRGGDVVMVNPAKEPGLVKFSLPKSMRSMLKGGDWIASEYLQPRIGSDLALFKGIAKAVLAMGAEDRDFIQQHTENFTAFADDVEKTSWADIEDCCGIGQSRIEEIADMYARAEKAVFVWGMGMTHHHCGVANVEYIANLALLRGMVGKPSAGLLPLRGHSNIQGIGSMGVKPQLPEDVLTRLEALLDIKLPEATGMDTLACLQAADRGEMDMALMLGGNLYAATPDATWAAQALDKVGLKVFLNTTLNQGHVVGVDTGESLVLPVTARDEEWQPTTQESMFNYVRLSDGGIDRLDNVRPEVAILSGIGARLLADSPVDFSAFESHRKIREVAAETIPGMAALAEIGEGKQEFHVDGRLLHSPEFNRPNQRACFVVHDLPERVERRDEGFPFALMTVRSEGQYNSIIYEESDSYRGTKERWSVLLSPEDISALGIAEGDFVNLVSEAGRMDRVRVYGFDLPQGNVMAYYPEANVLVGQSTDARSQTPAFKSVPIAIEPCVA